MSRQLWRWAARSAHLDAEAAFHEHLKTAAFVDAVGRSSKFLKAVSPVMVAFTRMSHFLRGMELPAGDGPQIVKNWNTSEEFLEGAEQAYQYALRTAFSPVDSVDLDVTSSHSFRKWVKEQQALYAQDFAESQDFELDSLLLHFQTLAGPKSLETLQKFGQDASSLDREQLMNELQQDFLHGADLKLGLLAVAEVSHKPQIERRVDRLLLQSSFNLAEGISSDFQIAELESLSRQIADHFDE